jgi:hypothetical protein
MVTRARVSRKKAAVDPDNQLGLYLRRRSHIGPGLGDMPAGEDERPICRPREMCEAAAGDHDPARGDAQQDKQSSRVDPDR